MPKMIVGPELFDSMTLAARLPELLPDMSKPVTRVPTGWALLDAALAEKGVSQGGFVVPSTVVIGAPPKAGKSIWAQHLVQNWVQRGHHALYWDLENGAARFARRLGWRLAKIASRELSRGLDKIEQKRFDKMVRWYKNEGRRFAYASNRGPSIDDVAMWCDSAESVTDGEPWCFVVDSLQKLPGLPKLDRRMSIDVWLRFFEGLRENHHCVVIIVSELNRASYGKEGGGGYKESGDIEYTCDLGMSFQPIKREAAAWLDVWWDRDGHRDASRVAKYTRVLPYFEVVEEAPRTRKDEEV